jgi:DNA polymerase III alpha subunit (gram-positive type)
MREKRLAFIDVETTGMNPLIHEVIEIGCLIAKLNEQGIYEELESFEIKVKPEHIETAEQEALRVNRYDEANWVFAHTQKEAFTQLAKKCEACVLVAQNTPFDYSFLLAGFMRNEIKDPFFFAKLDTISLAYLRFRKDPEMTSFSLKSLCEKYGIKNEKAHNALADIRATFEVFKKLMGA